MLLDFNQLIKKHNLKITGAIHIGAHHGQEVFLYEENEIKNLILFEPLRDNFLKLKENVKNPSTRLVNLALGSKTDMVFMNVETANQGQSSSILEPKLHLQQYPQIVFNRKEKVSMTTLDKFFEKEEIKKENFNLINIDVQGYELEVFKGATETLRTIDYIFAEVNRAELYKDCASVVELDEFLSNFGFERVETNWEGITWGDALYVKRPQI
tara:strand:- start:167 stop:802 length:636 start_codon:yes stop_codon:yes gene_type:complete